MCADKPSALYAAINEGTTNFPSQYAIPTARVPIAAEKEQKVDVYTGHEVCKQADIYEEIKESDIPPSESLDLEEVKEKTINKSTPCSYLKFALLIAFIIAFNALVVSVVILFVQMRNLHEMNRTLQKSIGKLHHDKYEITEQTNLSNLYDLVLSMDSKIKQFNISFMNIHEAVNDYISAHNNTSSEILTSFSLILDFYLSSCSAIARLNFSYASGNYIVRSSTGVLRSVYCDMNRTFGGNSTGWMRVAELDVNNCSPGLRHEITNSDNTCVVIEDNASCTEIIYPVYNLTYTQIAGQIRGYQVWSSDGFVSRSAIVRPIHFVDLKTNYLDGVSISTNGQHIWSFAAGCNCLNTHNKPTIIGQDYTCDGVEASESVYNELLWASQQCGKNSTWFYKVLPPTTTDIKVRICRDQFREDEDLAIKKLELYIL